MGYAADPEKIKKLQRFDSFHFYECDINDDVKVKSLVEIEKITHIINFAAETHVDNSIVKVDPFIYSNICGVSKLIEVSRATNAHLIQISTDEVYGVPLSGEVFDEASPLKPRNPYSATKAAADHLVLAAINTYGISAHIIRPSNNFGPGQHGEKFIPTVIRSIQSGQKVPIYGDGKQSREWTYVKDTAVSIANFLENSLEEKRTVLNLSSEFQIENLEVVAKICEALNESLEAHVEHVTDRPGHDRVYRICNSLLETKTPFEDAIRQTIISSRLERN